MHLFNMYFNFKSMRNDVFLKKSYEIIKSTTRYNHLYSKFHLNKKIREYMDTSVKNKKQKTKFAWILKHFSTIHRQLFQYFYILRHEKKIFMNIEVDPAQKSHFMQKRLDCHDTECLRQNARKSCGTVTRPQKNRRGRMVNL